VAAKSFDKMMQKVMGLSKQKTKKHSKKDIDYLESDKGK
jgi:hypothetical protein